MATMSSTRMAGKAIGGQGGNGNSGRYGLKAKLATGVAILGCAAALAFGGVRLGNDNHRQAPAPPPVTTLAAGTDDLKTTSCIGAVGLFACPPGQSLAGTDDFAVGGCVGTTGPFACANLSLPGTDEPGGATALPRMPHPLDWEQVERTQVAP